MVFLQLIIYIAAFILIWLGSGLIVSSSSMFSKKLKLSSFAFSFVFLGILTSTPEFSVGLQAVANGDPEIFVGNLLGGIVVLFLVVIPFLAITGNGVSLKHELDNKTLLATLAVILAPSVFILDRRVTNLEGGVLVVLYLILLYMVERKKGIFNKDNSKLLNVKTYSYQDIFNILVGISVVFVSSNIIVEKTMYFAELFHISAFYISLIVIALGTDLPELSLAVRSVISGNKDIAMGDYIGAAAASTLLFGVFTLLHNGEVLTINNFFVTFIFIVISLAMFYVLSRSKMYISRREGFLLLAVYVCFLYFEIMR